MLTTISKWGNSLGVRIPKNILIASGIREQDDVMISVDGNRIIITKAMHTSIKGKKYGKTRRYYFAQF